MKSTKKPPKPAKTATKDEVKDYEKGTPAHILDNPDYLDQVNRYMPEFYQDPALSEANKNNNRTSNGNST